MNENLQTSEQTSRLSRLEQRDYAHTALSRLAGAWSSTRKNAPNNSGMRAAFRRFKPEGSNEPTMEMRQYIWGWIGSPFAPLPEETVDTAQGDETEGKEITNADQAEGSPDEVNDQVEPSEENEETTNSRREVQELEAIDQAAIVVAMRAASGDYPPTLSLGQALYQTGMSDLRLMRLLTSGKDIRMAALHRVLRLVDAKRLGITWNKSEVRRVLDFLYGSDRVSQKAGNDWASDFFRERNLKKRKDVEKQAKGKESE